MSRNRVTRRSTLAAAACAALLLGACGDDKDESTRIVIDDTEIAGSSRSDLLRDFVANIMGTPIDTNMLADANNCDMGRSTDDVYFAPTWGAPGESTASCTMKAGQTLFLSPVAAFCFESAGDAADEACLAEAFNLTSAEVLIDGEPVDDLASSLVQFDAQDIEVSENNIAEVEAGPTKTIGKGYVVMVENMEPGDHEIVLKGDFGNGEFAGSLTMSLTVE